MSFYPKQFAIRCCIARATLSGGTLSFTTTVLAPTFTAINSVQPGGIHPMPGQTTGGNGSITGQEVQFNINFTTPFNLSADHISSCPKWRSPRRSSSSGCLAPRPIVPPGTPFPAGFTDLQSWTRDEMLDPDWLRIGMDIVGGATPRPSTLLFRSKERCYTTPCRAPTLRHRPRCLGCSAGAGRRQQFPLRN